MEEEEKASGKRGMWAESRKKRKVPNADMRMQGYPGWEKKTSFFIFFDYFYGIVLGNKHISELEYILIF